MAKAGDCDLVLYLQRIEEKSVETALSLMLAYAAGLKRLASLIGIIGLIESLN